MEAGCEGRPIHKVSQSWKNILLVALLLFAVTMMILAYRCESAAVELTQASMAGGSPPEEASEGVCASLVQLVTPRHLLYLGGFFVLAWCCCPCFKLECDPDYIESRSCFLRSIQRRRRARRARNRPDSAAATYDDEEEP